jgi:chromosome segregation ATPase
MRQRIPLISLMAACSAVLLMVASCAPTYDSIADQMLADTQKQADGLLKLESLKRRIDGLQNSRDANDQKAVADARKQASYDSNIDFYDKLQSSITALDTRMTAMPDLSTPKLSTALSDLEKNVAEVRSTHASEAILGADYVRASRQILDQQFKALTVYELTIKGGSKPN